MKAKVKSTRQVGNVHFQASVDVPISSEDLAQTLFSIGRRILDAGVSLLPNDVFDIDVRFTYIPDEDV